MEDKQDLLQVAAARHQLSVAKLQGLVQPDNRAATWRAWWQAGLTLAEIGAIAGLTRSRVSKILRQARGDSKENPVAPLRRATTAAVPLSLRAVAELNQALSQRACREVAWWGPRGRMKRASAWAFLQQMLGATAHADHLRQLDLDKSAVLLRGCLGLATETQWRAWYQSCVQTMGTHGVYEYLQAQTPVPLHLATWAAFVRQRLGIRTRSRRGMNEPTPGED